MGPEPQEFDYYEAIRAPAPNDLLQNKTRAQLQTMVITLQKEKEILNRELKSKQLVIDIKTKEAERMKRALDTLLDSAALVNMFLERD